MLRIRICPAPDPALKRCLGVRPFGSCLFSRTVWLIKKATKTRTFWSLSPCMAETVKPAGASSQWASPPSSLCCRRSRPVNQSMSNIHDLRSEVGYAVLWIRNLNFSGNCGSGSDKASSVRRQKQKFYTTLKWCGSGTGIRSRTIFSRFPQLRIRIRSEPKIFAENRRGIAFWIQIWIRNTNPDLASKKGLRPLGRYGTFSFKYLQKRGSGYSFSTLIGEEKWIQIRNTGSKVDKQESTVGNVFGKRENPKCQKEIKIKRKELQEYVGTVGTAHRGI